ncbi:MAG: hypothetical protein OJF50_002104 [Nitrospira sp.]|jgi:hypothetical protein|nr:hypothetical protein [Nitrospira sp.]
MIKRLQSFRRQTSSDVVERRTRAQETSQVVSNRQNIHGLLAALQEPSQHSAMFCFC